MEELTARNWLGDKIQKYNFVLESITPDIKKTHKSNILGYWASFPIFPKKNTNYFGVNIQITKFSYDPSIITNEPTILVVNRYNLENVSNFLYNKHDTIGYIEKIGVYYTPSDLFDAIEKIVLPEKNCYLKTTQINLPNLKTCWEINKICPGSNIVFNPSFIYENFSGIYIQNYDSTNLNNPLFEWYKQLDCDKLCIWNDNIIKNINYIGSIPKNLEKTLYKLSITPHIQHYHLLLPYTILSHRILRYPII